MFSPGDVVRFHSPTAGKEKFHLCLCVSDSNGMCSFLHLNSGSGFAGDCILDDGAIPGLPKSPTGNTVVSFSQVVKMLPKKLKLFGAAKTGDISLEVAGELLAFARDCRALTDIDKPTVVNAFEKMIS
jgi:hypothetical protein